MTINLKKLRRGDIVTVEMQYCSHDDSHVALRPVGAPYATPQLVTHDSLLSSRPLFTAGDDVIDPEGTHGVVRFIEGRHVMVAYDHWKPLIWHDTELRRPEPVVAEVGEAA